MEKDKSNNIPRHVDKIFYEYGDWSKEKQQKVINAKLKMFSQSADFILKKKPPASVGEDFEDI